MSFDYLTGNIFFIPTTTSAQFSIVCILIPCCDLDNSLAECENLASVSSGMDIGRRRAEIASTRYCPIKQQMISVNQNLIAVTTLFCCPLAL
jgi:hypothetical protein